MQGNEKQTFKLTQQGITAQPSSSDLRYSAGLSALRLKDKNKL